MPVNLVMTQMTQMRSFQQVMMSVYQRQITWEMTENQQTTPVKNDQSASYASLQDSESDIQK